MTDQIIERQAGRPAQTQEQYEFIIDLARKANIRLTRALILARTELTDACAARDVLARECNQLEKDRGYNASLVMGKDRELARMRGAAQEQGVELAQAQDDLGYFSKQFQDSTNEICVALGIPIEEDIHPGNEILESIERLKVEPERLCIELAQGREELKDAQNDLKLNAKMLADQCDQARQAENERDEWRRRAQVLEMDLYHAAEEQVIIVEAARALIAQLSPTTSSSEDMVAVWNKALQLRDALEYKSKAAAKLLERLAEAEELKEQLMRMEAARDFWRREYRRNDKRLADLDAAEATLQHERALRQVAETGERAARKALQNDKSEELIRLRWELRDVRSANRSLARNRGERLEKAEQRAERAGALAQLVTPGLANVLVSLANATCHRYDSCIDEDAASARELAAQIREALDGSQA